MDDITIYAAGEIHSDWRDELRLHLDAHQINARVVGPQEVHDRSDAVGEDILGAQPSARYRDLMGARVNTLRTRILLQGANLVVAYFGPKYKQWNTAMDAGFALALDIPLILVRDPEHTHALKEIDALATFTVETLEQAAKAVAYVFE
ncbi:MAG TPA: YtoQ family protein [Longimicrobiales bacterium]|nr:YtoQ family protein [Longimicrobiales bacterium]